uniref:exodeoxyribonuclease III n=1 Tax=Poecilia latipinna TaxID=48699 RepID=A0A3B3VBG7_9TELE
MSEDCDVNGFTVQSGHLVLYESPVETIPIDDLLTSFIDFLRSFQRPVLLAAHNVKRFDAPVLTRVMKKYDLYPQFQQVVSGFLDTFLLSKRLFLGMQSYSQVSLVKIFLQRSYDAHNAEEDAKMLQELYKVWRPDQFTVLASTSETLSVLLPVHQLTVLLYCHQSERELLTDIIRLTWWRAVQGACGVCVALSAVTWHAELERQKRWADRLGFCDSSHSIFMW